MPDLDFAALRERARLTLEETLTIMYDTKIMSEGEKSVIPIGSLTAKATDKAIAVSLWAGVDWALASPLWIRRDLGSDLAKQLVAAGIQRPEEASG